MFVGSVTKCAMLYQLSLNCVLFPESDHLVITTLSNISMFATLLHASNGFQRMPLANMSTISFCMCSLKRYHPNISEHFIMTSASLGDLTCSDPQADETARKDLIKKIEVLQ